MQLLKTYKSLPSELLNREQVISFWEARPMSLLELCLGAYTKASPLTRPLNLLRPEFHDNPTLDDLAKKMRSRERRFGDDWWTQGHHPQSEVRLLKKEVKPLCAKLRDLMAGEPHSVSKLALEVLAKGWQFGELPASSRLRSTPEKLLNRATRLKLWEAGQEILFRDLGEDEIIRALWDVLHSKITPAVKSSIEAQGHTVSDAVSDLISFDLQKSRGEITS
jgi:hypothetical protein